MTLDELFAAIRPPSLLRGYEPSAPIAPDRLWAGAQPTPLTRLKYPDTPRNPPSDTGLDPSDDWQKRGSDTAAMALSILYPEGAPIPIAATQPSNPNDTLQPIPSERLWAGVQPTAFSTMAGASRNAPAQVQQPTTGSRALSQMRTDPAWQQDMKKAEGGLIPQLYDPTHKGDYTIGFGHKITGQPEFSNYLGKTISPSEAEALYQRDLAAAEGVVRRNVIQPLTQNQFDALVDFVFQAGGGNFTKSDIYTYTNLGDYPAAQRSFSNTNASTTGAANRQASEAKKFGAP